MVTAKRVYAKGDHPRLVPLSLWWTPAAPCLHRRQNSTGSFASLSSGVTALFLWVLVQAIFCCALQDWNLCFPQSCESLVIKSCGLQDQILRGFPVPLLDPQAGKPDMGSEPSQQWENLFGIIVLQFVDCLPGGYGTLFYHNCSPPTILLWILLCLWIWGIPSPPLFW